MVQRLGRVNRRGEQNDTKVVVVVGTDTHSTTYGAFNVFGTGVEGTSGPGLGSE